MELTQLNSTNNLDYVNQNKDGLKTQALINDKEITSDKSNDSAVELDLQNSSNSDLTNNLTTNVKNIVSLQQLQSTISNQLEITTEIIQTTTHATDSENIELDDKQPEIKSLLDNYNNISESIDFEEGYEEIGVFFDGILGSKPLSSKEIIEAVEERQFKLKEVQEKIEMEMESINSQVRDSIDIEKNKTETKIEYKNIDFEKESFQFNSNSLNNLKEGIISSQANATTSSSIQLLA